MLFESHLWIADGNFFKKHTRHWEICSRLILQDLCERTLNSDFDQSHNSNAFDFNVTVERKSLDGHTPVNCQRRQFQRTNGNSRPRWFDISPILHIHLVHLGEVVDVRQENVDFNNFLQTGSSGFKHDAEVLDTLMLF